MQYTTIKKKKEVEDFVGCCCKEMHLPALEYLGMLKTFVMNMNEKESVHCASHEE